MTRRELRRLYRSLCRACAELELLLDKGAEIETATVRPILGIK